MFDLGWSEIAVIAVVALVVIGPKDLPIVLRTVGQYVRKARAMAAEFQSGIEQMARETELEQMRKEIEAAQQTVQAQTAAVGEQIEKALDTPVEVAAPAADPPMSQEVASEAAPSADTVLPPETPAVNLPEPTAPVTAETSTNARHA